MPVALHCQRAPDEGRGPAGRHLAGRAVRARPRPPAWRLSVSRRHTRPTQAEQLVLSQRPSGLVVALPLRAQALSCQAANLSQMAHALLPAGSLPNWSRPVGSAELPLALPRRAC